MTNNDDAILEFLDEHDIAVRPREIEHNLTTRENHRISYSTVNRRLKSLLDAGLIEKEKQEAGLYSITEKGRLYLKGDLDKEELQ